MEQVELIVRRDKSFVAGAMPYRVYINGEEKAKITVGKEISLLIPNDDHMALKVSMFGNSMTFRGIEKEVVIYPKYSKNGEIICVISTKKNWLGIITFGIIQAVGKIELNIEYR